MIPQAGNQRVDRIEHQIQGQLLPDEPGGAGGHIRRLATNGIRHPLHHGSGVRIPLRPVAGVGVAGIINHRHKPAISHSLSGQLHR